MTESPSPSVGGSTADTDGWRKHEVRLAVTNALKLGSSLVLTWTIALITRLYVPRFLGPERFGALNFADAFAATSFVVLDFGVDTYVRKEVSVRANHANDFVGGILALRLVLTLLVFVGMEMVLRVGNTAPEVRRLVYIYGASQFFFVGGATSAGLLQATGKVNELSILSVITKIAWAISLFVAILLHLGLWAFASTVMITDGARALGLAWIARKHLKLNFRVHVLPTVRVLLAALPFFVTTLATTFYQRIGVSLLGFMTSPKEVGWYGAANGFAGMTMLFAPLMSWVMVPLFARSAAASTDELYRMARRAFEYVLALAIPVSLVMILGADLWIRVLFGPAFAPAATAVRILSVAVFLMYVSIIAANALAVLNYTWRMSLTFVAGMVINPFCNVMLIRRISALIGAGGAGVAAATATLLTEIAIVTSLLSLLGRRGCDRRLLLSVTKNVGAAIVTVLLDTLAFRSLGIARLAIDAILYGAIVILTRAIDVRGMIEMVRRRLPKGETASPL